MGLPTYPPIPSITYAYHKRYSTVRRKKGALFLIDKVAASYSVFLFVKSTVIKYVKTIKGNMTAISFDPSASA